MNEAFGVFPDGKQQPAAVFSDLGDAIEWGLERFGADRFGIRYCPILSLRDAPQHAAAV